MPHIQHRRLHIERAHYFLRLMQFYFQVLSITIERGVITKMYFYIY